MVAFVVNGRMIRRWRVHVSVPWYLQSELITDIVHLQTKEFKSSMQIMVYEVAKNFLLMSPRCSVLMPTLDLPETLDRSMAERYARLQFSWTHLSDGKMKMVFIVGIQRYSIFVSDRQKGFSRWEWSDQHSIFVGTSNDNAYYFRAIEW